MSWSVLRHKLPVLWMILAAGSAVLYNIGLVFDWPEWLHGSNWVWVRRVPDAHTGRFLLLVGAFVVWVMVLWLVIQKEQWQKWQVRVLLVSAVSLTPFMQLLIAAQHRSQPLSVAFLTSVSFMQEGVAIENPAAFIQNHADQMPFYRSVHLQTQPPGWPVAFWAAREVWGQFPGTAESVGRWFRRYDCLSTDLQGDTPVQVAAAALQIGILFISGLGVLPLYGLGKGVFNERVARTAVWLYPLLPGFLVFQARFDVLYAVLALLAFYLIHRYLTTLSFATFGCKPLVTLSFLLAGSTFFAFGTLAIVGLVDAFLLAVLWLQTKAEKHYIQHSAFRIRHFVLFNLLFGAGLVGFWGGFWLLWQASWPEMFHISRNIHELVRMNYPVWPLFNLYDLGVFLGLPLMVLALWGGVGAVISNQQPSVPSGQWGRAFAVGWLVSLLVLDVSGEVRAETGRLWLFLAPPGLLIGVAALLTAVPPTSVVNRQWSAVVFTAFALQSLVTGFFLGGRVPTTTVPEPQWQVAESATTVSYQLGETYSLQGYEIEEQTNQLAVTLHWQALDWPTGDYSVFVHLEEDGQTISQSDGLPMNGQLPTWCWVPGEVVVDKHVLVWDGKRPYTLLLGLYDWRTGERLPVQPAVPNQTIQINSSMGE